MFHYIEYSRFALADISGLNANVFYELGHRHRVHEAGTVIFRQTDPRSRSISIRSRHFRTSTSPRNKLRSHAL